MRILFTFMRRLPLRKLISALQKLVVKTVVVAVLVFTVCEYLIYPVVLLQCSWPKYPQADDKDGFEGANQLRAMFLADTHLLGPFRGHWFDKLRREWQMYRSFQTAMYLFQPEVVFFLGDIFDEGKWVSDEGFNEYVNRFRDLFSVQGNRKTRSLVVTGNHDMGFHFAIVPKLNERFNKAFNTTSVKLVKLKGSNFLLVNSMAMQMDGCFLCEEAKKSLKKIAETLNCEETPEFCVKGAKKRNGEYSAPILLQHFPMFRKSDEACTGEDTAPKEEKFNEFREAYDCLSEESSRLLFKLIKPRLILSGHTHHHCVTNHVIIHDQSRKVVTEYSVPSFSWRNRNDPSFYLAIISPTDYHLSKCYLPKESTVYSMYISGVVILLVWLLIPVRVMQRAIVWLRINRITSLFIEKMRRH